MSEAIDHLESAIAEVTKARNSVMRGTSRQVTSADERDRLKSVAFAWLKTHRPHVSVSDLSTVDDVYQRILDSTVKHAARSTYVKTLKQAKDALVAVRRQLLSTPPETSVEAIRFVGEFRHDPAPDFSPLGSDASMQAILQRRWNEIQNCISAEACLAATVMMGGFLESLLLARINLTSNKKRLYTAKSTPCDKAGKPLGISDWKLVAMVEVAHEVGWITRSAKDMGNVLRDFRNYIHPHKEHSEALVLGDEDVRMFWDVSKSICRQILGSAAGEPPS